MKSHPILTPFCAVASLLLLGPPAMQAQNESPAQRSMNSMTSPNSANSTQVLARMSPAEASLKGTLDAKKVQPGSQVTAVLTSSAQLKDGTKLPKGTTLVGKVETDIQQSGHATLALRFTEAQLKDGKQLPIHATIVAVAPPRNSISNYYSQPELTPWNGKTLQFEQINATSGTNLHSRIAARNSATFVSKKDDVKLANGTQFELAIAARGNA